VLGTRRRRRGRLQLGSKEAGAARLLMGKARVPEPMERGVLPVVIVAIELLARALGLPQILSHALGAVLHRGHSHEARGHLAEPLPLLRRQTDA
jgi:hypothetical protein